jgi:lipoprotein-anchoring transpeptidase ErfK/SrfK
MKSPLEHKTIRPGSLSNYSFYYSNRRAPQTPSTEGKSTRLGKWKLFTALIAVVVVGFGVMHVLAGTSSAPVKSGTQAARPSTAKSAAATSKTTTTKAAATPVPDACNGNDLDKLIKISVSKRHLWACEGTKAVHDVAIISGNENYESTKTPVGTYKVYGKTTNTTLTGSDETGSWKRPVYYWMPFLDNQYGTYGFHDATWRADNEFGNVDPYSAAASHGCPELPLASMKWLYDWSAVGTAVTVEA